MMLFRSANQMDFQAIFELAAQSGVGITTLPQNMELLEQRLMRSIRSFSQTVTRPSNEYYWFVLEDKNTGSVVGTSAIEALTGGDAPFYSYKVSKRTRVCHSLNIRSDYEVLNLVNDTQGMSELCTLFLSPNYRHNQNGVLLSRARFLFMAHYPMRFARNVIAEMRGVSDEQGRSPFWEAVGRHFFHLSFEQADGLTLSTNKQFIADLMPRNPIYVKLLAPDTQAVIGKPHPSTVPAMNILLREGLRYTQYVDIFDAGPTLEAPLQDVHSVRMSRVLMVQQTMDEVAGKRFIVANTRLDFRATIGYVLVDERKNACILSKKTADLLEVKQGDCVRVVPLN